MGELRLICDREITIQQQRIDSASESFRNSLRSAKSKVQQTLQLQAKLGKLKAELREAEDGLVKALGVKTRKQVKRMTIMDSLSATKARLEELKIVVEDQRAKKDEYASFISQQSNALTELEEKHHQNAEHREEIEEAISWYNRILGLRIECGRVLDCDPHLNDMKEQINELNRSNGLFKFVRFMRDKFQEAAGCGSFPQLSCHSQDYSTITMSLPVSSVSTDRSESPVKQKELQLADTISVSAPVSSVSTERIQKPADFNRQSRKVTGKGGRQAMPSPLSASAVRRSPRFKV